MVFRKAFSIAFCNWKVLLKSLFFQLLTLTAFLSLFTFAFGSLVDDVMAVFRNNGVEEFLAHVVQSIANGTFNTEHFLEDLQLVTQNIVDAVNSVGNMWNRIEISLLILIFAFIFYRLLISYTDVTVDSQINEFMNSNSSRPFTWFLFKKTGKSLKFVGLQLVLATVMDVLIITSSFLMAGVCTLIFGWWAIIPVAVMGVLLYSCRLAVMAFCLPSIVVNHKEHTSTAFRDGLIQSINNFGKALLHNLLIIVVMTLTTALAYMFNENRIISTSISAVVNFFLFYLIKCVNITLYYEVNKMPYFHTFVCVEGTEKYYRKRKKEKAE